MDLTLLLEGPLLGMMSFIVLIATQYMDYLSKVLLPEAMSKIYMDVHGVSHAHAEEVMKGLRKEHPRGT